MCQQVICTYTNQPMQHIPTKFSRFVHRFGVPSTDFGRILALLMPSLSPLPTNDARSSVCWRRGLCIHPGLRTIVISLQDRYGCLHVLGGRMMGWSRYHDAPLQWDDPFWHSLFRLQLHSYNHKRLLLHIWVGNHCVSATISVAIWPGYFHRTTCKKLITNVYIICYLTWTYSGASPHVSTNTINNEQRSSNKEPKTVNLSTGNGRLVCY